MAKVQTANTARNVICKQPLTLNDKKQQNIFIEIDCTFIARLFCLLSNLLGSGLRQIFAGTIAPMNLDGEITTPAAIRCNINDVHLWTPNELVRGSHTVGNGYACLVLNRSVHVSPDIIKQIWQNAHLRCLIDGGANCWRQFLHEHYEKNLKLPEYITGDFDSITEETRKFFNAPDIKYQHTPDQDETDFTKALRFLQPEMKARNIQEVIALQENTGRFDQIMGNVNTLFKLQSGILNVYLLSSVCLSWLLLPGKHKILIPKQLVDSQHWCALIPIGGRANIVTTTGLKWNLSKSPLEFGYVVSTSNSYAAEEVCVETDSSLVWSMGLWEQED